MLGVLEHMRCRKRTYVKTRTSRTLGIQGKQLITAPTATR